MPEYPAFSTPQILHPEEFPICSCVTPLQLGQYHLGVITFKVRNILDIL